ncbi:NMD3 family domain containing protein [Russula decolorans]
MPLVHCSWDRITVGNLDEELNYVIISCLHKVLCTDCGDPIVPNSANLCINCLRNMPISVDITEGIPHSIRVALPETASAFAPPAQWMTARPKSQELFAICLKKLKGLNRVLTDSPRVSLTIKREVGHHLTCKAVSEHSCNIWFNTDCHGQCPNCARLATKNTWKAIVQVRQKQLILKHGAHKNTISSKEVKDAGLDFFYSQRSHAIKLVEFLSGVVVHSDRRRLLSADTHSNTANFRFTYSVEIVPICKDDAVCLPPKLAWQLGNIDPLTVCTRFIVLDVEPSSRTHGKWLLADAQVALSGAFRPIGAYEDDRMMNYETAAASTNQIFHSRSHPGGILQPSDAVMGLPSKQLQYQFGGLLRAYPKDRIPDVIPARKAYYPNRRKKNNMAKEEGEGEGEEEGETGSGRGAVGQRWKRAYELFLRDLEEDPEMRSTVNLYKADGTKSGKDRSRTSDAKPPNKTRNAMEVDEVPAPADEEDEAEADFPGVKLDEVLENFDEMTLGEQEEHV